jgi:hypothetical protein
MFLNNLDRAQYSATHRHFFRNERQRIWSNVYKCAYLRWRDERNLGDYDTMVAALGLGDEFWHNYL